MFPSSTSGIYCPGCQPGDFPQPHICGINNTASIASGYCYLCNAHWSGSHVCMKAWQGSDTTIIPSVFPVPTAAPSCDHCWCLKQKAGWHDVPSLKPSYPGCRPETERHYLKPHLICCNCGSRRLKKAVANG